MKALKVGVSYSVAFSPDGRFLAALGRDVSVWDLERRKKSWRAHPFPNPSDVAFAPDGRRLAVKNTAGLIVVLDAQDGRVVASFNNALDGEGSNIAFSSDGVSIVDGSWSGRLQVRRADSGAIEYARAFEGQMITEIHAAAGDLPWVVSHSVKATTPDRPPDPGFASIWQWPFGSSQPGIVNLGSPFVRDTALSPGSEVLAMVSGAPPTSLSVLRLEDGQRLKEINVDIGGLRSALRWSADGGRLASVQRGRVVQYGWPGLEELDSVDIAYPCAVEYSPNGDRLAIGSWEEGVVIGIEGRG